MAGARRSSTFPIRRAIFVLALLVVGLIIGSRVFVGPTPIVPSDLGSIDPEMAVLIEETADGVRWRRGLKEPRYTLGKIYESNKQYGHAARTYRQLIELGHGDAGVWYRYAYALSWDGDVEGAIEAIERSVELDGTRDYAYWRLALWLIDAGRLEEAEASIERARALNPEDMAPFYAMVNLHLARGEADAALELIESRELDDPETLRDSPHEASGYGRALRADALRRLGRFDEARAVLAETGGTTPAFHDETTVDLMRYRVGLMYEIATAQGIMESGDIAGAAARFRELLARVPEGEHRVHRLLGMCEVQLGNNARGFELLEEAVARSDNFETRTTIARVLSAFVSSPRVLEDEALKHARAAIEHRPNDGTAHETVGVILAMLGRHDEAVEAFDRAHELDARSSLALEFAGHSYIELRRYDDAMERFQRALSRSPERGDALVGVASVHAAIGRAREADEALRRAASLQISDRARFARVGERVDRLLAEQETRRDGNE